MIRALVITLSLGLALLLGLSLHHWKPATLAYPVCKDGRCG